MSILNYGPIGKTRRSHALEHATIHILSRMRPQISMAGRSSRDGFFIYGDISTETIKQAAQEAIDRMRSGEVQLAIHPNCGTNMLTTAMLTASATMLASAGKRRHLLDRIPSGLLGAFAGVIAAQFLGPFLQERLTTNADLGPVQILEIKRREIGRRVVHWVQLQYADSTESP
ncbi:MAG: hypothetical protein GXP38_06155 [Chloroflexi bacterium]|nr:hypothetical protein [Chloroflexota bacterium]